MSRLKADSHGCYANYYPNEYNLLLSVIQINYDAAKKTTAPRCNMKAPLSGITQLSPPPEAEGLI